MTALKAASDHGPHLNGHGVGLDPGHDLRTAWLVQQCLFPRDLPRVPGWDCAAVCRPARVVAGDYHDLFALAPGHLALALGDVAGKGLGPALVMAGLHALVRCRLSSADADLAALATELNHHLLATTPEDTFVTLFLAVLDVTTGRLRYVNAGHPPALLLGGSFSQPVALSRGGPLLGILPEVAFEEGSCTLEPDGVLALFSDGITEACNPQGEMFGPRLLRVLRQQRTAPAATVQAAVLDAVTRFTEGGEQADDLSLLVLRRTGV